MRRENESRSCQLKRGIEDGSLKDNSDEVRYSRVMLDIANKRGLDSFAPIALSYLYTKYPRTFPIIGFQTKEVGPVHRQPASSADAQQLHDSIRGLDFTLTKEEMETLESEPESARSIPWLTLDVKPLDLGFPGTMIGRDPHLNDGQPGGNVALQLGTIDWLADRNEWRRS